MQAEGGSARVSIDHVIAFDLITSTYEPITKGFGRCSPFTVTLRSGPSMTRPFLSSIRGSAALAETRDRRFEEAESDRPSDDRHSEAISLNLTGF